MCVCVGQTPVLPPVLAACSLLHRPPSPLLLPQQKRGQVRIAALAALRRVMHFGAHEMILEMVAFRDPNVVPVAAFYGGDLKVNFAGKLATDPNPQARASGVFGGEWVLEGMVERAWCWAGEG